MTWVFSCGFSYVLKKALNIAFFDKISFKRSIMCGHIVEKRQKLTLLTFRKPQMEEHHPVVMDTGRIRDAPW